MISFQGISSFFVFLETKRLIAVQINIRIDREAKPKGNIFSVERVNKAYETAKKPSSFPRKYPLSKRLEKSFVARGKEIIPKINVINQSWRLRSKSVSNILI